MPVIGSAFHISFENWRPVSTATSHGFSSGRADGDEEQPALLVELLEVLVGAAVGARLEAGAERRGGHFFFEDRLAHNRHHVGHAGDCTSPVARRAAELGDRKKLPKLRRLNLKGLSIAEETMEALERRFGKNLLR